MDEKDIVLERLDSIIEERDYKNKKQLAISIDMPYTTIVNLYKRGSSNSRVSTLLEIANKLDITMDYLLGLQSKEEMDIIRKVSTLNTEDKKSVIDFINSKPKIKGSN